MSVSTPRWALHLFCCSVLLIQPSCKRLGERVEITSKREVSAYESKPKLFAYSNERFGNDPLTWDTPEGWTQAERTQMRPVNLKFGKEQEGECYLSMLPGGAGGVPANVNRWRGQMGQPELTDEEIASLPRRNLMGIEGVFVSADGNYTNVGQTTASPDQRLIGIIAEVGEMGLFVKMVGPKALVEENTAKFEAFVASLKLRTGHGAGGGM